MLWKSSNVLSTSDLKCYLEMLAIPGIKLLLIRINLRRKTRSRTAMKGLYFGVPQTRLKGAYSNRWGCPSRTGSPAITVYRLTVSNDAKAQLSCETMPIILASNRVKMRPCYHYETWLFKFKCYRFPLEYRKRRRRHVFDIHSLLGHFESRSEETSRGYTEEGIMTRWCRHSVVKSQPFYQNNIASSLGRSASKGAPAGLCAELNLFNLLALGWHAPVDTGLGQLGLLS